VEVCSFFSSNSVHPTRDDHTRNKMHFFIFDSGYVNSFLPH